MGPRLFRRGNNVPPRSICFNFHASMGPRLFRRGNPGGTGKGGRGVCRFNGATSFQTWKYHHVDDILQAQFLASMGPRLFRRGNNEAGIHRDSEHQASMGPRLFRRGNQTSNS